MTQHFAVDEKGRTITLAILIAAVALVVGSAVAGLAGLSIGYLLTPVWVVAAAEAGRVAWAARAEVEVGAGVGGEGGAIVVETPLGTEQIAPADIAWFGLTSRGLVIETDRARHTVFDQFPRLAGDTAEALSRAVAFTVPPKKISYDAARRSGGALVALLFAAANGVVLVASILADTSSSEKAAALILSIVLTAAGLYAFSVLVLRPYQLRFVDASIEARPLLGPTRTLPRCEAEIERSPTTVQRVTGAPPGDRLVVHLNGRRWRGPVAAPGTFGAPGRTG